MVDQRTPNLNLPLPHASNDLTDDVERIRDAFSALDSAVAGKASVESVQGQIDSLVDNAPVELSTLGQIASAIGVQQEAIDGLAEDISGLVDDVSGKMPANRAATDTVLGGVKVGNGLNVEPDGTLSIDGSSQAFSEVTLTVGTPGQTVFTVPGGYTVGAVQVLLNGYDLVGGGDDYSATNGTSITLTTGVAIDATLILRRWNTFQVADVVPASVAATKAEMEAGTEPGLRNMSPLRVKQAIDALATVAPIRTPVNAAPANAATNVSETPTLTGGAYLSLYGLAQNGAQFQVSTTSNFGTILHDSGTLGAVTTYCVPAAILAVSTTYHWRTRYRDAENVWSAWSAGTSFTTAAAFNSYIATPTATPSNFGDALEGGFYAGMIWGEVTTSSTSKALATGSTTFTTAVNMTSTPLFYAGQSLEVRSRANPDNRFQGTVTGAVGTTLTLNVATITGSGTFSDWSIMARHRVIVAPKASGENASVMLKNANTALPTACQTLNEGLRSTQAMRDADTSTVYPAAHWARALNINSRTDWYIPARDELELCWRNLKPVTNNNYVTADRPTGQSFNYANNGAFGDTANTHGLNNNSSPTGAAYTTTVPGQVAATAFRTGGAEAFEFGSAYYWSSTEYSATFAWLQNWYSSNPGSQSNGGKTGAHRVRAIRRSVI